MNVTDHESVKACGAYVLVRAASGATVRIVNECPWPCAPGQLDLSRQAFPRLADLSVGRLPITWSLLSPDLPGRIAIRYKTGSTKWWCGIQVIGHRNPVAALEVRAAGGWRQLPRTDSTTSCPPMAPAAAGRSGAPTSTGSSRPSTASPCGRTSRSRRASSSPGIDQPAGQPSPARNRARPLFESWAGHC
ncbi:hypothetical protein AV521_46010 [Streptomyces sp. IMTB 2501]|nr:hypothetical protein AV521_46010 [Streptomyces sp. IMTB 2501]